ncbi:hypothetical protein LPMP_332390, partial [Leishmania panamensis]
MNTLLTYRDKSPAAEAPFKDDNSNADSASQSSYTTNPSRQSSTSVYSTSTSATDHEAYHNLQLELDVAYENIRELHQKYEDLERTSNYAKGQLENDIALLRLKLQRAKETEATPASPSARELELEAAR